MSLLNRIERRTKLIIPKYKVKTIIQDYNRPGIINEKIVSSCIKCVNPKCILFSEYEIGAKLQINFSYDRNLYVCPVGAIKWNYKYERPIINSNKCIKCGLCINRCPVGAIYIDKKVKINIDTNLKIEKVNQNNIKKQEEFLHKIPKYIKKIKKEDYVSISNIVNYLQKQDGRTNMQNVIIRNIIIALGNNCAISRPGDVHTRIDAIYKSNNTRGPIEIEFGRDTLDAARSLLDDVADLNTKKIILVSENMPIVVCLTMPNKRQGYYQVIKDINKILHIKIQTISLGALLILMWNGVLFDFDDYYFYVDFEHLSYRKKVEKLLKRVTYIKLNEKGIFEPEK